MSILALNFLIKSNDKFIIPMKLMGHIPKLGLTSSPFNFSVFSYILTDSDLPL